MSNRRYILWSGDDVDGIFAGVGPVNRTKQESNGIIFSTHNLTLNPHEIMSRLPVTTNIRFVGNLSRTWRN